MALASGLGHTTAIAEEVTYGTAVVAGIRGYEVDSNSMVWNKYTAQGKGLRGSGLVPRANRRVVTHEDGGGEVAMDLATSGMGMWLKHAMGGYAIAQEGATPAFRQTFTFADLATRSLTVQTGLPDVTGALQPYTYAGCKIAEWGIGQDQNGLAKFSATIDARSCTTGTGYATPDFTRADAAGLFHFKQASLYVAGSGTAAPGGMSFALSVNNNLKTDRYHLGGAGLKANQLNNGWIDSATITVETEYIDQTTWLARNFTDETFGVVIEYVGAVISGAFTERLKLIAPAVKINSGNPTADGPEVVDHSVELQILDNGTDQPLTIEYTSTDTSA